MNQTIQKKNRITLELQTDDDRIYNLYRVMSSNGTLSEFIESLIVLRLNNYDSKIENSQSVNTVKSDNTSDLTFDNSILNLLYDVKEAMEEIKESIVDVNKQGIDLTSIGDVVKNVLTTVPVVQSVNTPTHQPVSNTDTVVHVQEAKDLNLSYLDNEITNVVRTHKSGNNENVTVTNTDSTTTGKKPMKNMNMAKLKKLKGGW